MPSRFGLRNTLADISRTRHIVQVLVRNGLGFLLESTGLAGFLPFWRKRPAPDAETVRMTVPQRVRRTLEELGPTYIKLGQMLSTRPDILPHEFIVELSKLLDAAPPAPYEQIVQTLERELGISVGYVFREFAREPMASASIGQVHEAELYDGTKVVVKIQRPGVEETVEADLSIILAQARFLEAHSRLLREYRIVDMAEELARALRDELNYTHEGRHADTLRELLGEDQVIIPRVFWALTTRSVITLERLEGIKLSQPEEIVRAGHDPGRICEDLADIYLRQVFVHGVFHADPHPANILVTNDGRIGLMDFGSVGYLGSGLRDLLGDLLLALVQQDPDDMVYVIARMGATGATTDRDELRVEMQRLIAHYYGATLQSVPIADFLSDVMSAALRHKVRLPSDLALLARTVMVLEGVTRSLDPAFDLAEAIEPFARGLIRERLSPRRVLTETANTARQLEDLAHVLPRRFDSITDQLERGDMTMGIDVRRLPDALQKLDSIANRLAFSIIVAGLIIGSAMVLAAGAETAFHIPFTDIMLPVPQIGFLVAGILGAWLLISMIRSRRL